MQVSFLYRRCWFIVVHLLIDDILVVCDGPCWITKDLVGSFTESRKTTLKRATLLGSNIAPLKGRDDFPFRQGEYVSSLEGKAHQDLSSLAWAVATARAKDSAAVALLRQADDMSLDVRKAPLFVWWMAGLKMVEVLVTVARCLKDEMFPGRQVSLESAKSVQSFCYLVLVTAHTKLGKGNQWWCRVVQGLRAQLCW